MNVWCSLYYAVYMFGFSGAGFEAISFCMTHPQAAQQVLLYCICGAAGQVRITRGASEPLLPFTYHVITTAVASERLELRATATAACQNFIFMAISSYGSLVNITITTTRKARTLALLACRTPRAHRTPPAQFFNVLLSVFYNKSYLQPGQWWGVALVFLGLGVHLTQCSSSCPFCCAEADSFARRFADILETPAHRAAQGEGVRGDAYTRALRVIHSRCAVAGTFSERGRLHALLSSPALSGAVRQKSGTRNVIQIISLCGATSRTMWIWSPSSGRAPPSAVSTCCRHIHFSRACEG